MRTWSERSSWAVVLGLAVAGCADSDDGAGYSVREGAVEEVGYGDRATVIIMDQRSWIVSGTIGEGCVQVEDRCIEVMGAHKKWCGKPGGLADLYVLEGSVVAGVCYPSPEDGLPLQEVTTEAGGKTTLPQNANGAVVVFDPATDGEPIPGDLVLKGERAVLFGNGPLATLLDGSIEVQSNNARLRGLRESGLSVAKNSNNVGIAFSQIRGNLTVAGNGVRVLGCEVFGDLHIEGNGAVLADVGVQGTFSGDAECHGCYSFADANGDFRIDSGEVKGPLGGGAKDTTGGDVKDPKDPKAPKG